MNKDSVAFCPFCGSNGVGADRSAILAGNGGGYRIPAIQIQCTECEHTIRLTEY